MLDRKFIIDNAELVQENCHHRGAQVDIRHFVELDAQRKKKQFEVDELNRQANAVSKTIGKAKDAQEREARKEEGRRLRDQTAAAQVELEPIIRELDELQRAIPNLSHPDVPVGVDDKSNLELRRGKYQPRQFDFKPLDHVELGEKLDLMDFEAGAKVTGHGFYYLKNEAVLLELALQRFAVDRLMKRGFTPMITPDLARNDILQGTGYIPRGPEAQIYRVEDTDLSLIATAEITLGGIHVGDILEQDQLPIKYCGISHCYRTEAGAHGKATRGLFRVHQFTKIEMFVFALPEQSEEILEELCQVECDLFDELGIPYRVVDTATGDLGGPAYRKYDLEAWMPGRGEKGEFGEVTSTSNCTDFQARRLGVRYRSKGEKGTQFVHTLNGTAIAISRALVAILENYQQADGSVLVPDALRGLVGTDTISPRT